MKAIFLTSTSFRHKYIADQLSAHIDLQLVIAESKAEKIEDTTHLNEEDADLVSRHFELRRRSEVTYFGAYDDFPQEVPVLELQHGGINSKEVLELVQTLEPDLIVLFGTSILKDSILKAFENRIVNLHLGLSPYYRGSATNLFPYYYHEPECIGATIHVATSEVDRGGILHQFRPEIELQDDLHSIGNKTILKAGMALPKILKLFMDKKISPQEQQSNGKICRNKDLTPDVLREIYRNFDEGMIKKYLEEKDERDSKKPIVDISDQF